MKTNLGMKLILIAGLSSVGAQAGMFDFISTAQLAEQRVSNPIEKVPSGEQASGKSIETQIQRAFDSVQGGMKTLQYELQQKEINQAQLAKLARVLRGEMSELNQLVQKAGCAPIEYSKPGVKPGNKPSASPAQKPGSDSGAFSYSQPK